MMGNKRESWATHTMHQGALSLEAAAAESRCALAAIEHNAPPTTGRRFLFLGGALKKASRRVTNEKEEVAAAVMILPSHSRREHTSGGKLVSGEPVSFGNF
jgi:hypothetical protein